ncbi:MAG TPA: hypothetical protein PLC90_06055 [Bacteroidales bacterium]|nr:hypothetical protein [Bacteroidales bacterium]
MIKYFISRVLPIFIASFFIGWAFNTGFSNQLNNFFDMDFWFIFKILVSAIILIIGVIVLNLSLTLLYWNEYLMDQFIVKNNKFKKERFSIFRSLVFDYRFSILKFAFVFELERERYRALLIGLVIILVLIIYIFGVPFINNYYAIFGTYEMSGRKGDSSTFEVPGIVVPKNSLQKAENEMMNKMPDYVEDVRHKGYVFMQTALIDGYKSHSYDKGFGAYIGCLPYYAFEKLIVLLTFFLFPFIIIIIIIEIIKFKIGDTEEEWDATKKELIQKNNLLKETLIIIRKYQLDEEEYIKNAVLSFENALFESKSAIIISRKKLFAAKTLLILIEGYYTLIPWAINSLHEKTYNVIKNNLDVYHFSSKYEENPYEKAKEYLSELEKKELNFEYIFTCLLGLIPQNEIDIDIKDFSSLGGIENRWKNRGIY